jgi:hypothetical protein
LRSGETKKKGAGGKFTWGSVLAEAGDAVTVIDKDDPNYDSEDDPVRRAKDDVSAALATTGGESAQEDEMTDDEGAFVSKSKIVQAVNELKEEVRLVFAYHTQLCAFSL